VYIYVFLQARANATVLDSSVPRQFDLVWKTPDSGKRVQSGEGSAVNGVEKTLVEEKGELTMGSPKKVNDGDGVVTDASNGTVRTGASSFDGDSGNNTTNAADVDAAGVHDALLGDIPTLSSTSLASATTPTASTDTGKKENVGCSTTLNAEMDEQMHNGKSDPLITAGGAQVENRNTTNEPIGFSAI
jgi:hypothetical protein